MKSNFIWLNRASGSGKFLANIDQISQIKKVSGAGREFMCISFANRDVYENITLGEFYDILLPRLIVLNKEEEE